MSRLTLYATAMAGAGICLLMLFAARRIVVRLTGGTGFADRSVRMQPRYSAVVTAAGALGGVLAGSLIGASVKRDADFVVFGAFLIASMLARLVAFPERIATTEDSETEDTWGEGWLVWRFLVPYSAVLVASTTAAWYLQFGVQ